MKHRRYWVGGIAPLVVAAAAAFSVSAAGSSKHAQSTKLTKVTLQLKWVTQAQFAGYYAAKAKGYYKQAGLDVSIKVGGPDIIPETVVAGGAAQFGLDWVSNLLAARDSGTKLVDIAQVFQRSGMTELTWKDTGLNTIGKLRGKKVGNWLGGNQWELFAALTRAGMDPTHNKGVRIVKQPFTMDLFLHRQIDAASAMTYNELAQVLESKDPKTGKLVKPSALNIMRMQKIGTGMLEDDVFTTEKWISSPANQAIAKKFLAASFRGWIYCRDHLDACTNIVLKNGPALPHGHQRWMMNEINALIWPSPKGLGIMDPASFKRTATISKQFGVIKKAASSAAYRTDLARAALATLRTQHVDVTGRKWKKANVKVTPGGK
jgi:NitT/TauT family transport system substrate-binding protein